MLLRVGLGVVAALVAGVVVVMLLVRSKLATPLDVQSKLTGGEGDVERGRVLASSTLICTECHKPDFAGGVMIDDLPMGTIVATNLTGRKSSLAEWDLAVRHGVRADKTPLVLMPSSAYTVLSAGDMRDLAAFLNSLPLVDRALPRPSLGPVASALVLAGKFHVFAWHIDHQAMDDGAVEGAALARGPYLIKVSGCRACHGEDLAGAPTPPGNPPAPSITAAALSTWNEEAFNRAMREGRGIDGHALQFMPWRAYAGLPAEDLHEMWVTLSK